MVQPDGECPSLMRRGWRWLLKWIPTFANVGAVVTSVLVLVGYCTLQPTLVKLRPEPVPCLSSLGAYENVTWASGSEGELRAVLGPAVWLEGYITNDGTALASGLALEVALQEENEDYFGRPVRPVTNLLTGTAVAPSAHVPDVADALPWEDSQALLPFRLAQIAGWARLYLPPIPPGTYVQVFVGLPIDSVLQLSFPKVAEAVVGDLAVRLVRLTEPTRAAASHGEGAPGRPEVLQKLTLPIKDAFLDWHGIEG